MAGMALDVASHPETGSLAVRGSYSSRSPGIAMQGINGPLLGSAVGPGTGGGLVAVHRPWQRMKTASAGEKANDPVALTVGIGSMVPPKESRAPNAE